MPSRCADHRHARLLLHARDQALAAARHDHVDAVAVEPASMCPTAARSVVGTIWIGGLRQAGRPQPCDQAGMDRARGMHALGAAAQDRGVAGLQAQRAGIGGRRWAGSRK